MNDDSDRRRLRWQCRRGMLELDALLLAFLEQEYDHLPGELQRSFQRLLEEDDPLLFRWLFESPAEAPSAYRELICRIRGGQGAGG